jgi:hypothetical protein
VKTGFRPEIAAGFAQEARKRYFTDRLQHGGCMNRKNGLETIAIDRREFLRAAALALAAGTVVQIAGCGTDEASGGGGKVGSIDGNHGHSASVAAGSSGDMILNIRGTADHDHTLDLTAQQVSDILDGIHTMWTSSTATPPGGSAHEHLVHFNA